MSRVMTVPDYSTDPYLNLVRQIIESRTAYERLCGLPPTVLHVDEPMLAALEKKGFCEGAEVAGMKIIGRPGNLADTAICSRDADLFKPPVVPVKKAKK
jgi:hypothetical protein